MSRAEFETALTAQSWTQQEMDDLRAMLFLAVTTLNRTHNLGRTDASEAISRWNAGGVSAKVSSLPADFQIPNPTDLAGTGDIDKENLQNNLMAYVTTVYNMGTQAHTDNILPLVGSVNIQPEFIPDP